MKSGRYGRVSSPFYYTYIHICMYYIKCTTFFYILQQVTMANLCTQRNKGNGFGFEFGITSYISLRFKMCPSSLLLIRRFLIILLKEFYFCYATF